MCTTSSSSRKKQHLISSCDHLLPDILLRLPLKSSIRFSLVSKSWYALITKDSRFHRLLISNQNPIPIGLLFSSGYLIKYTPKVCPNSPNSYYPFETLDLDHPIISAYSCNGLLLLCCSGFPCPSKNYRRRPSKNYYVFNPTTKKSLLLPPPHPAGTGFLIMAMCLAFDPLISPYYYVVALTLQDTPVSQIFIYSSSTGIWILTNNTHPFIVNSFVDYNKGVYWNGSIHWVSPSHSYSSYFNLHNHTFHTMPTVPVVVEDDGYYFGESNGHLYYAHIGFNRLHVYEMKTDYSEWFVKYSVCLAQTPMGIWDYHEFIILSVVWGKHEDDSFLLLYVPTRIIRFSFVHNTCQTIHDMEDERYTYIGGGFGFQYIESFCSV